MTTNDMHKEKLEVSVVDKKGIFARGSLMGRVVVNLSDVVQSGGTGGVIATTDWYTLEEDDDDSD